MSLAATANSEAPVPVSRVIVVPRPLAAHFRSRLARLYEDRGEVRVVVDRRVDDRRQQAAGPPAEARERRNGDRRSAVPAWSLMEMPTRSAGDPAAAGSRC